MSPVAPSSVNRSPLAAIASCNAIKPGCRVGVGIGVSVGAEVAVKEAVAVGTTVACGAQAASRMDITIKGMNFFMAMPFVRRIANYTRDAKRKLVAIALRQPRLSGKKRLKSPLRRSSVTIAPDEHGKY